MLRNSFAFLTGIALFAQVSSANAQAPNLVINGDLEDHTGSGCQSNLDNSEVGVILADCIAFGNAGEIDLYDDPLGCYGLTGPCGLTKIALNRPNDNFADEIAFVLAPSVVAGTEYILTLRAMCETSFDPCPGVAEIGLSNGPDLGTTIAALTTTAGVWDSFTVRFTAPVSATHLSVTVAPGTDSWIHFDCFGLRPAFGDSFCPTNANSTGSQAVLTASGSASIAANDLTLWASPMPDEPFVFLFGTSQFQAPFGNGFLCIGGVTMLRPILHAAGNTGSRSVDLVALGVVPGTLSFQCLFRDSAGGGANFNMSNALSIGFVP